MSSPMADNRGLAVVAGNRNQNVHRYTARKHPKAESELCELTAVAFTRAGMQRFAARATADEIFLVAREQIVS